MSTISFSSTGPLLNPEKIDDVINTSVQMTAKVTVVNSEVVTVKHFDDPDKLRSIRVLVAATGADAPTSAAGIVSIVKTDAITTTITFGASAAGTYWIVVEN
jgi:hypothetical protein